MSMQTKNGFRKRWCYLNVFKISITGTKSLGIASSESLHRSCGPGGTKAKFVLLDKLANTSEGLPGGARFEGIKMSAVAWCYERPGERPLVKAQPQLQ